MILKNTNPHTTKADMHLVTINQKTLHRINIRTKAWSSRMKQTGPILTVLGYIWDMLAVNNVNITKYSVRRLFIVCFCLLPITYSKFHKALKQHCKLVTLNCKITAVHFLEYGLHKTQYTIIHYFENNN